MNKISGHWGQYCSKAKQHFYTPFNSIGEKVNRKPPFHSICGAEVKPLFPPINKLSEKCKSCKRILGE